MPTCSLLTRRDFLAQTAAAGAVALMSGPLASTASAAAGDYPIGCYTRPWYQSEWPVAFDAIAEAGFKHIGLMTTKSKDRLVLSINSTLEDAEKMKQEAAKRGMSIVSIYGGGFPAAKSIEEGVKGLQHLIDVSAAAGCASLLLGGTNEKTHDAYYKCVAECCDYAAEKKVELAIKPHGGSNATGPQLRKIIESVGKKNFRAWYDAGNMFFYSEGKLDPVDDAPTVADLVSGWCIKDYLPPKDVFVTAGTGKVNFPAVFAKLRAGGFKCGPLVVETFTRTDPAQYVAEARKVREFLEKMVAG